MKIQPDLVEKYNTAETVLVISTYPRKGHTFDPQALAVAPFTKNKINALRNSGRPVKFVVIADNLDSRGVYEEDGHLIIRAWERNNLAVYKQIQNVIDQFPQAQSILFEHEFGIYGIRHAITAQLPLFLLWNRLRGKSITTILHQVIFDLAKLSGHLQVNENSPKLKLLNLLIQANYWLYGLLSNHVVVHDQVHKANLSRYVTADKIEVLPLGHEHLDENLNRRSARKELGFDDDTFYIVSLGYVTWYKGADWLVENFKKIVPQLTHDKKVKLILAGGESSSLEIDRKYMQFYQQVTSEVTYSDGIELTGVLPEEKLSTYATAADLLVMPYRVMMSSSGIFTIIQQVGAPVILSESLQPLMQSKDVQIAVKQARLTEDELFFKLTPEALYEKLEQSIRDDGYRQKLSHFTQSLASRRNYNHQAEAYFSLLSKPTTSSVLADQLAFSHV